MILLPLGFGSRLPTFPYMTLAIAVAVCAISIPYFKNIDEIDRARAGAAEAQQLQGKLVKFAQSACTLSGPECGEVGEILKLAQDERKINESIKHYADTNKLDLQEQSKQIENIARYLRTLRQPPDTYSDELKQTEGYADFKDAYDATNAAVLPIYKQHNFFTKKTKGFLQLLTAQFTHGGWEHLLGNLFVFIAFGAVLEARMGPLAYSALYLAGGTIGLLVELPLMHGPPAPLLGASANIAAVIGAFFVFYFRRPMKVLASLIVYNKVIEVPTWAMVGGSFLLADISGAAANADSVAHVAHLTGFAIGALGAYVMKMNDGLNDEYLFPVEYDWHKEMLEARTTNEKLAKADLVLKYNPNNSLVMNQAFAVIASAEPSAVTRAFLARNFARAVTQAIRTHDRVSIDQSLDRFPPNTSMIECMKGMSARDLITLSEHELKEGHWLVAMRVSDAFRYYYPKQKASAKFESTMRNVLSHLQANGANLEALETYRKIEPKTTYKTLLTSFEDLLARSKGAYERAS